ncbi:transcription-repair coupling factor [Stratiformator vulcanicus]|uniref:Transcription-repair-coupling factor n=1 Tax=Stratiformator vulcanicus TaxID=2527980 RepID=A0A517R7J5_9PLAN|nr:transcription-repair coupling factor [Stratiformator vulcanicus]QDT39791.1 Transcription-repair-coupling factor [Stratiformator vulcanicus]
MSLTEQAEAAGLGDLPRLWADNADFGEIATLLRKRQSVSIDGAWGSACALVAATIATRPGDSTGGSEPLVCVTDDVDDFAADLSAFLSIDPVVFPAWESLPSEHSAADPVFGRRLRLIEELSAGAGPTLIVTSLPALIQPIPPREVLEDATRFVRTGDEIEPDELMGWLVSRGFERVDAVERPGEFAMRGGILDVWTADAVDPLRIEFFGDEIDGLRRFDVDTQRKVEDVEQVRLTLINVNDEASNATRNKASRERKRPENPHPENAKRNANGTSFLDLVERDTPIVLVELERLIEEARTYLDRLDDVGGLFCVEQTLAQITDHPTAAIATLGADSAERSFHLDVESVERFAGDRKRVINELASIIRPDERVLIACHNEGERRRLNEMLVAAEAEEEVSGEATATDESAFRPPLSAFRSRVSLTIGRVTKGFRLVPERLTIIGDNELFGRTEVRRLTRRKRHDARAIDTFLDLKVGDLIVHLTNGIGRYRGMKLLEKGDQQEEHLELEFADGLRVFVPVSLIHLVQKYIGAAKAAPPLSKLGGKTWARKKERVAEAVKDMAADMIRMQAARESAPGIACPPDSHWQKEFEDAFPYTETPDQVEAIHESKGDMLRERPMDRLICGDVGYGKTEVALRAAFKAVDAGRQVAVLVPTTVLCEQHLRSFSDRLAEFPITVESLSRFRSAGEQRKIVAGLKTGGVDIVIGTHRLVSKDVEFKDLGLLVIDEEQRFGVEIKESLKRLRLDVDVMTLSATPIPRTLHMSLLGIRDISNLVTPPQDRQAIETRISRWNPGLIRNAIVRELNRGGQAYFVHNRVHNIRAVADKLQAIVPEASIGIIHGQMGADELEMTLSEFVLGRIDILVATTIIESGLDIPNANTMFIHQADKYGLADLHQLRGRVGRYKHRAYCYLILEEGRTLTPNAARRLKAIEEYSELGAGFKIAMRDLEIRGAGNILGNEQSGHISSVGYELYCQLLENAVRGLKGEQAREPLTVNVDLPVSAFIPNSYIPSGRPKIETYRKFSNVRSEEELTQLVDELRDRFGPIPSPVERLIEVKRLQVFARYWKIEEIRIDQDDTAFLYRDESRIEALRQRIGRDFRVVDRKQAFCRMNCDLSDDAAVLERLKSVLRPSI